MASEALRVVQRGAESPLRPVLSTPPETLATLRVAVSMAAMTPQVRQLFETMLDCMEADASVIAALKAANAELRDVVQLDSETESILRGQLQSK